jgi:hypothetical protein
VKSYPTDAEAREIAEARAEKAEARVAELEAALRQIRDAFPVDEDAPGDDYAYASPTRSA